MNEAADVTAQVRQLADLGLQDLRAEWRRLYGAPPKLRSPELLRLILAWRIQAEAFGGFDEATKAELRRRALTRRSPELPIGTKLTREWKGVRYEAEVVEGGIEHAGDRYASLSEIARLITGARWNGPRFFGLREDEA